MARTVRVMLEQGKKRRVVACAFDWPGWDRSTRLGGDVLDVLESYRPRYAQVADLAGYGAAFAKAGALDVVEELEGTGMSDYYGVSGRTASAEVGPMTAAECDRKVALLKARTWELQTLVRRLAWHMLDHAWELEDRDLTGS